MQSAEAHLIDVLVPTRHRPHRVRAFLKSLVATAENISRIRAYFYVDEDDSVTIENAQPIQKDFPFAVFYIGPRRILSNCWNSLWERSSGQILMHAGDDILFESLAWDSLVEGMFNEVPDRILLVYGQDGIQNEKLATHSFTHRDAAGVLGYFVPPYFKTFYNDTWLTEVYRSLGRARYVPKIVTKHLHFSVGPQLVDDVYLERRKDIAEATAIWNKTAQHRKEDALKLREYMDSFAKKARAHD